MKQISYLILSLLLFNACSSEPKTKDEFKDQASFIMPMLNLCEQMQASFFQSFLSGEFSRLSKDEIKEKEAKLKAAQKKCVYAKRALFELDKASLDALKKDPLKAKKLDELCSLEFSKNARKEQSYKDYLKTMRKEKLKHYLECKNARKVVNTLYKPSIKL